MHLLEGPDEEHSTGAGKDRKKKNNKAQHPVRFKHKTSWLRVVHYTTVLQPRLP